MNMILFLWIYKFACNGWLWSDKTDKTSDNKTSIIALNAGVMAKDIDKSIEAGMDMHIAKPIVYAEMNQVLVKYFDVEMKE